MWRGCALLAVVTVVACGGRTTAPPRPAPPAVWRANAVEVVRQLRADVAAAAYGGETARAARHALSETSDLYALLIAYSDLGGCRAMVAGTEAPPRVQRPLAAACAHLQRAADLFGHAAAGGAPASLVRATREARLAEPYLVEASLALR